MFAPRTTQVVVAKRQNCPAGGPATCFPGRSPSPSTSSDSTSPSDTTISTLESGTTTDFAVSPTATSPAPTPDPSSVSPTGITSTSGPTATSGGSDLPSPASSSSTIPIAATTAPAPSSTSSQSPIVDATSTTSNAGTIAGSVVGGIIFLVLVALALLLYLRARKRKRTAPSSEFLNSLGAGTTPVLRLDSGAEFTPAIAEKGGGYTQYPSPNVPLPFTQNSYYSSPPMQDMKFPDEFMLADIPSARPSVDQPLHPQRYSTQATNESFGARHHHSSSVGSQRELWGSDAEIHASARDLSPVRLSPRTDSVLHFAPRFSLDDLSPPPSQSPPSLHPLRRQPD